MDNFDKLYHQLMETMTAGGNTSILGPINNGDTGNHIGTKDTFASGNLTNPFIFGKKKKRFQKRNAKIEM